MKGVRPLTQDEVLSVLNGFDGRYKNRNLALFIFQFYTGRRISQTLSLRIKDIVDKNGKILNEIYFERKNVKGKKAGEIIYLHRSVIQYLSVWLEDLRICGRSADDYYLFQSDDSPERSINRLQAYRIYKKAFKAAGLSGRLGTHSLRKTFAKYMYEFFNRDITKTQRAMGHTNVNSTVSYLDSFQKEEHINAIDSIKEL